MSRARKMVRWRLHRPTAARPRGYRHRHLCLCSSSSSRGKLRRFRHRRPCRSHSSYRSSSSGSSRSRSSARRDLQQQMTGALVAGSSVRPSQMLAAPCASKPHNQRHNNNKNGRRQCHRRGGLTLVSGCSGRRTPYSRSTEGRCCAERAVRSCELQRAVS